MKKLALAGLALIATTMSAAAAIELTELHAPPSVEVSIDADVLFDAVDASELETLFVIEDVAMQIGHIEGATRVVGKSQGFLGLPIKDVAVNCPVCGPDTPAMVTAWLPTPDEIKAINSGAAIHIQIQGTGHPPILVDVGPKPDPV